MDQASNLYMISNSLTFDYYPFGSVITTRTFASKEYRFGFNGMEKDDEVKGDGNSINYKFRVHDPRLGRFLSYDPLTSSFPWNSSYAFCENRVIDGIELEGLERVDYNEQRADGVTFQIDYTVTHDPTNTPGGVTNTQVTNNAINNLGQVTSSTTSTPASGTSQRVNGGLAAAAARGNGSPGAGNNRAQPASNPPPNTSSSGKLGVPQQFNQASTSSPTTGTNPANPPMNFAPSVTALVNNTPTPGSAGTPVITGNTSRIMVVTNGTVAANANAQAVIGTPAVPATGTTPAVPATGLMAQHPNIQFSIVSDPSQGLNNDQVDIIQNPTTDFITPGSPQNTFNYNPTVVMPWTNSRGLGSAPLPVPPLVNLQQARPTSP
jgi:RHS repeat-associated protein